MRRFCNVHNDNFANQKQALMRLPIFFILCQQFLKFLIIMKKIIVRVLLKGGNQSRKYLSSIVLLCILLFRRCNCRYVEKQGDFDISQGVLQESSSAFIREAFLAVAF